MPRRILAIDGGGLKGIFAASFIARIEDEIGDTIASYFDLIAGTSSGGILALGLAAGLTGKDLVDFYEKDGPVIFAGNRLLRAIRHFALSKYSHQPLREALTRALDDRRLGDCNCRVLVPTMNLETGQIHVYRTPHHPSLERDRETRLVDVATATVSAPTYFPIFKAEDGTPLIDGSMWAKNPVALAVVEAIGMLNWPRDDIRVLSLGCTTAPLPVRWDRKLGLGRYYWGGRIADVFMKGQSSSALVAARLLVGYDNVVRVNPTVGDIEFQLDAVHKIPFLKQMGEGEAERLIPLLKHKFLFGNAESFKPQKRADPAENGFASEFMAAAGS